MKVKEEKAKGLNKKYEVTLAAADFAAAVDKKLAQIAKTVKLPGFRAGHAPKNMVSQKYRAGVLGEVLDDMIRDATNKVIEDNKLRPAVTPDLKITKFEDGKDIEFTIEAEVLPEIALGDFSKISLNKYCAKVPAEEIEKAIKYMADSRRDSAKVEENRAAKKGDIAVIDFVGSVDGVEFQGGKGTAYPLELGSNSFIPGYEDQLIGKKAGETVEVKTTFPKDYHTKDLAGKDAVFVTTIKELRTYKTTEINDDFAKSMGAENLPDLKAKIEARIQEDYASAARMKLKRDLLDILDKEYSFEVPQKLIDAEYAAIEKQYKDAKAKGQLDESEKSRDEKDILAEYKEIALRRVKLGLLLSEIGSSEKLSLTADDVNKAIMNEAKRYPGQEKTVLDYYLKNKQAVEALKAPAYEEKIVDFVLAKAKIADKEVSVEELYDFSENSKKESKAKSTKKKSA